MLVILSVLLVLLVAAEALGIAGLDSLLGLPFSLGWIRLTLILALLVSAFVFFRRRFVGSEEAEPSTDPPQEDEPFWTPKPSWIWGLVSAAYLLLITLALFEDQIGFSQGAVLLLLGAASIAVFKQWLEGSDDRVGFDTRSNGLGGGLSGWTLSHGLVRLVLALCLGLLLTLAVAPGEKAAEKGPEKPAAGADASGTDPSRAEKKTTNEAKGKSPSADPNPQAAGSPDANQTSSGNPPGGTTAPPPAGAGG